MPDWRPRSSTQSEAPPPLLPMRGTGYLLIADNVDDSEYRLWARWGLWNYQLNHCEFSNALVSARHFSSLATDPADVAAGDRMLGVTLHYLGSHAQARQHLESVLSLRIDMVVARSMVRQSVRSEAGCPVLSASNPVAARVP